MPYLTDEETVRIKWKDYVAIKNRALEEGLTMAEALHEILRGSSLKSTETSPAKSGGDFTCSECGKSFATEKQLRGHMLGAHNQGKGIEEEEESFECSNCGREFDTKQGLRLHQNYCGKSASQSPRAKSNE